MPNKRNRKRMAPKPPRPMKVATAKSPCSMKVATARIYRQYSQYSHRQAFTALYATWCRATLVSVLLCRVSVMEVTFPLFLTIPQLRSDLGAN